MKKTIVLVTLGLLAACSQEPHSMDSLLNSPPTPPIDPNTEHVESALRLDIPNLMQFNEGAETSFEFKAISPRGAEVKLEVSTLPDGAIFDEASHRLTWKPSFVQGDNPENPSETSRTFPVVVKAWEADRPEAVTERRTMLWVKDVLRDFNIEGITSRWDSKENSPFTRTLTLNSVDFPNGPFTLDVDGAPPGVIVKAHKTNPREFEISYLPDEKAVTIANATSYDWNGLYREVKPVYIRAKAPRGEAVASVTWRIQDARNTPEVVLPTQMEQGLDVLFPIVALDPNFETTPDIQLYYSAPFGKISIEPQVDSRSAFTSRSIVRWTDIPLDKLGYSASLQFRVCNLDKYGDKRNCKSATTTIKFVQKIHAAPIIDRKDWPVGEIKATKEGKELSVKLPIRDAEGVSGLTVKILPTSLASEVKFSNNSLSIKPITRGTLVFLVQATSAFQQTTSELFQVESMPTNWAETVLMADSTLDPEVVKTQNILPAEVLNPHLTPVTPTNFLARKGVIVGTSILRSNRTVLDQVESTFAKTKWNLLSSPLLGALSPAFLNRLQTLGTTIEARYKDTATAPPLSEMSVIAAAGTTITRPTKPVRLNETLTLESASPALLKMSASANCAPLLQLKHDTSDLMYTIAVVCPETQARKMLVAGFEWAQLTPDASEADLPKTWINEVIAP